MGDGQPQTEREKYIANLEGRIRKAAKAKRFKESEDGGLVTEFLTDQVNGLIKTLGGTKYINDHNMSNYDRGQLAMAQKILTMLNSEAATDTTDMQQKIDLAKTDE